MDDAKELGFVPSLAAWMGDAEKLCLVPLLVLGGVEGRLGEAGLGAILGGVDRKHEGAALGAFLRGVAGRRGGDAIGAFRKGVDGRH
jgi:hypothetical protein